MGLPSATTDMGVFALERLMEGSAGWRGLTREMALRWPESSAGEIIFALMSAARTIEAHFLQGGPAHEGAVQGYRLAGMIGLDLYALQVVGISAPKARELLDWWEIEGARDA